MEFYSFNSVNSTQNNEFQFPTGWNSTVFKASDDEYSDVSIPNGMEFYDAWGDEKVEYGSFQFPTGWNSTLIFSISFCSYKEFQFPTGWNSTIDEHFDVVPTWRFNSQRDGILLKSCSDHAPYSWVSIPNGMEFYPKWSVPRFYRSFVSIPNGMEFYSSYIYSAYGYEAFQFPTGWNSTNEKPCPFYKRAVSIPNGMEFYIERKTLKSPTKAVSIPNGMEFY